MNERNKLIADAIIAYIYTDRACMEYMDRWISEAIKTYDKYTKKDTRIM